MLQREYLNGVEILSVDYKRLMKELKNISGKIKKDKSEVSKIILFGSFAKGNFTPYSDIDIAIIVKNSNKNFIQRQDDFIDYFNSLGFDVNLIVYTEEEYKKMKTSSVNFIKQIDRGVIL